MSKMWLFLPLALFMGACAGDASFSEAAEKGLFAILLIAFGKGVLTSLTPCVYPMIPITLAVFGAKQERSKLKSLLLAVAYVEGMAVFYTVVGTPFALAGKTASGLLANPWVVHSIALLLFVLAASFFGAFNLNLPSSWQNKLSQVGGSGFRGAFLMGLVAGPIAAPCTGPFLIDMIATVAKTGDVFTAAAILFTYAHGIGVLFLFLAVSASSMPKSGPWMDGVKSFCAILLLVGAYYFLRPVYPGLAKLAQPTTTFALGALGVAIVGMAMGGIKLSFAGTSWAVKIRKGIGVFLATVGLIGLVNWYFTPKRDIKWVTDEVVAFEEAKAHELLVLVDFGAKWCAPCLELEKIMAEDDVFADMTKYYVPLKFDVTEQNDADEALMKKYNAGELPAILFLDADGKELARYNDKSVNRDSFVKTLRDVAAAH